MELRGSKKALIGWLAIGLLAPWSVARAQTEAEMLEAYRKQGWLLLEKGKYESAARVFGKVREKEPEPTFSAALGQATALNGARSFDEAARLADYALGLAHSPEERARTHLQQGLAAQEGGRAGKRGLRRAEDYYRQALDLAPDAVPDARYLLGLLLLELERDDEGAEQMRQYLAAQPEGEYAESAHRYAEDPASARTPLLPAFEAWTLAGDTLSTESLAGKVVLFDFWGTWCEPCRAAIPHLRELARKNEDEPFVIVGIASDTSARKVKDFLRDRQMDWPQILDSQRKITHGIFGVSSYPTYILVDHEGAIVFRQSAWSRGVESKVSREVRRAIERAKQNE